MPHSYLHLPVAAAATAAAATLLLINCSGSSPPPRHVEARPVVAAPLVGAQAPTAAATPTHSIPQPATKVAEQPEQPDPGRRMGRYQLTYYWVAGQKAHGGKPTKKLRDRKCKVIARVSSKFRRALMREGTGKLSDGRVINVSGGCRCGKRCFLIADEKSPYGYGAAGRSLKPFRSIAAPTSIKVGTILYVPELDGLTVPGSSDLGGSIHNGCVVADDRGGGVTGKQLDLFTGKRTVYKSFFKRHKLNKVLVFKGGERCEDLESEGIARQGAG